MRRERLWSGIAALAAALSVMTVEYASAGERDHVTPLSDSLTAVFEAEDGVHFDAASAGLDDYLAYAAQRNPALKATFYGWRSLLDRFDYVGALPDPSFSYTYYIDNVETRVGPQNQGFMLGQSFPWFGTLGAKKDVTHEAANASYQRFESEKLKLFYQVKSAYYEYFYWGRDLAITRENLELLTFWESVARAKYRVALKQHPDVIKAQVELGKLEDRVRSAEDRIGPVIARLHAVMNLPDSVSLPVPMEVDIEEAAVDDERIVAETLMGNPNLKSLLHLMDKERAAQRLAGKMSRPSFFVGLTYVETGEAISAGMPDSGKDPFMASVGVTLPIWFGANKARQREAESDFRRVQSLHADAQNQLTARVEQLLFEYKDALRKTRLYRDGLVPKAEQSLNANYTAYQAGEADFLNLLDAQRQLLDFQLEYERSRTKLAISRAEIEMMMGRSLPTGVVTHE